MSTQEVPIASFLKEVMRRRKRLPSQLAADLGVSHATVSRWLSGADVPSIKSCRRLTQYSGVPVEKILSIVGHLPSSFAYGDRAQDIPILEMGSLFL